MPFNSSVQQATRAAGRPSVARGNKSINAACVPRHACEWHAAR
jgi:hypothetical protein